MAGRSAFDAASLAIAHTRRQLWPFQWSQWWRLALLGIATGEAGSSFARLLSGPPKLPPPPPPLGTPPDFSALWSALDWIQQHLIMAIGMAVAGLIVASLLLLVWSYVNSVCRFVLIDAIVGGRTDGLAVGWRRWRMMGRRYFVWLLLYQLVVTTIAGSVIIVALGAAVLGGWFADPAAHIGPLLVTATLAFLGLFVCTVAALLVMVFAKDFVAPIMAVDEVDIGDAWRRLVAIARADLLEFVIYIVVKVAVAGAFVAVMLFVTLALLVPTMMAGVAARSSASNVVLWVGSELVTACALFGIGVPLTVGLPAYGLYFLAARHPPLDAWLQRGGPHR